MTIASRLVPLQMVNAGVLTVVTPNLKPERTQLSNVLFFFSSRRRHTRLQGDWSSDVCSSDLVFRGVRLLSCTEIAPHMPQFVGVEELILSAYQCAEPEQSEARHIGVDKRRRAEIGRASCRERV